VAPAIVHCIIQLNITRHIGYRGVASLFIAMSVLQQIPNTSVKNPPDFNVAAIAMHKLVEITKSHQFRLNSAYGPVVSSHVSLPHVLKTYTASYKKGWPRDKHGRYQQREAAVE
jgi:hypothetical protein